jgi:hypothetical protein
MFGEHEIFVIYARNEENPLPAEAIDEYRDNERNSKSKFLLVYASNEPNASWFLF